MKYHHHPFRIIKNTIVGIARKGEDREGGIYILKAGSASIEAGSP